MKIRLLLFERFGKTNGDMNWSALKLVMENEQKRRMDVAATAAAVAAATSASVSVPATSAPVPAPSAPVVKQ